MIQFFGFLIFLVIAIAGFWILIFLSAFLPFWIGGSVKEIIKDISLNKKES